MLSYVRGRFIDRASVAAATVNLRHNPTAISIANFEKHLSSATQSSLTQIKWISIFLSCWPSKSAVQHRDAIHTVLVGFYL
jgi:hypothetical protein